MSGIYICREFEFVGRVETAIMDSVTVPHRGNVVNHGI
jgi:hypothetical protein